jgi:hypothetical protein
MGFALFMRFMAAGAAGLWASPCLWGLLPLRGVYGLRPVYEVYGRLRGVYGLRPVYGVYGRCAAEIIESIG